jgi:predicted nucleotidyltransferase
MAQPPQELTLAPYANGLLARLRREIAAREQRASALRQRVQEAASRLTGEYGARCVWLFGSLAWGDLHEESDVDVLVEGLPAERWEAAAAFLEEAVGVPVDLIRSEEAPASLVERVRCSGRRLHERG